MLYRRDIAANTIASIVAAATAVANAGLRCESALLQQLFGEVTLCRPRASAFWGGTAIWRRHPWPGGVLYQDEWARLHIYIGFSHWWLSPKYLPSV